MRRRTFLQVGCMALLGALSGESWMASATPAPQFMGRLHAALPGREATVVALFLRGGLDALHTVVPLDDPLYPRHRPRLALPPPGRAGGVVPLDARFGLNPVMAPLLPFYRDGILAVIQAIGTPIRSRSHFQAQDFLECGGLAVTAGATGWMNRLLERTPGADSELRAVATTPALPLSLRGPRPVASLPGYDSVVSSRERDVDALLGPATTALESSRIELLQGTAATTRRVARRLQALRPERYRPARGVTYPAGSLGSQLKLLAFLIKSGAGVQVAFCERDGFDTHAGQAGPRADAPLNPLLADVAQCLSAFWRDLGALQERVVVVTMTEFGRRVRENGSMGTDHGSASCAFVLGGGVRGGRVLGRWPGLAPEQLRSGMDLPVTTDYRDLFMEVAARAGCPDPAALFPGYRSRGATGVFAAVPLRV